MSAGKAKKGGDAAARPRRTLTLTRRAPIYAVLWVGALIFTQALRSTASNIFFTFVVMLPPVALVYLLIARSALKVSMLSKHGRVEKHAPYSYDFRDINESVIAFPFTEAVLVLPQSNAVRCSERTAKISMSPRESYNVKNTVRFRFRGTYEIGVRCFYVYDLFRILCLRIDVNNFESVEVLPRRLGIANDDSRTASDSAKRTVKLPHSYDKLEVSDVREYRLGDTLKSIHWNLSSKSEDLVVRDYNTGTTDISCIYCDMTAHFPDEPPRRDADDDDDEPVTPKKESKNKKKKKTDKGKKHAEESDAPAENSAENAAMLLADDEYYADMNEFCADGVVELTIAAVLRELRSGSVVRLMWFDERAVLGAFAYEFTEPEDFELVFDLFATAPLVRGNERRPVTELAAMQRDTDGLRSIYVVPALDGATLAALCGDHGVSSADRSAEVMLYDPAERYYDALEHLHYIDGCRVQLAENGAALTTHGTKSEERYGGEHV